MGYLFTGEGLFKRVARWFVVTFLRLACNSPGIVITCQNQDDRALLLQKKVIHEDRCIVIAGVGIDPKEFPPTEETEDGRVVLYPGRLLWDKGLGDLVEASRILKSKGVRVEVVMAGEPDPENPASIPAELVRQWERDGLVTWVGRQSDMGALYRRANIVCVPSYREGLSRSLIEASCSGRAAIATDVPGCRDIVVNGFNGLIVPPKCPKELAEALQNLLENPQLRKVMGENGHQRVKQYFASEVVLPMYVALYSQTK
jgi:glycosyltransferase involved in cell wall biosynthesis